MIVEALIEALKGAISGAIASGIGYAKQDEPENWDLGKASKTVILGMFVNAIVRGTRMPIPELATKISEWLATEGLAFVPAVVVEGLILTGIIIVTDQLVKLIVRRTDVNKVWNKFKEFIGKYWKKPDTPSA